MGTQTSAGYVSNGQTWNPPPAAPTWRYGLLGGIALAIAVGVVFVLVGQLLRGAPQSGLDVMLTNADGTKFRGNRQGARVDDRHGINATSAKLDCGRSRAR